MTFESALKEVTAGRSLAEGTAHEAMRSLMKGEVEPDLIKAFLSALRQKGETAEEITGFARAMRELSKRISPHVDGRLTDTCSTGGASVKTFNLGTTSAFVAASAGVPVAKHGNRSNTRPSGSADLLEALGANLDLGPEGVLGVLEDTGVAFLFAPTFHPAMKHAVGPRKELGGRTVFNLLGPLTNPAGAEGHVMGVYADEWVRPVAEALKNLGVEHAIVFHSHGSDEPRLDKPTRALEVQGDTIDEIILDAADAGLGRYPPSEYPALSPPESAELMRRVLAGGHDGPTASAVTFLSGIAIYVGGQADSIDSGVDAARDVLDSGAALHRLDAFLEATRRHA